MRSQNFLVSVLPGVLIGVLLSLAAVLLPGVVLAAEVDEQSIETQNIETQNIEVQNIETRSYVQLEDGNNFTVINTVEVTNRSARPIRSIYIRVPLTSNESVHWQEVLSEEFLPQPQRIETAEDGSRTAVYYIAEMETGDNLSLVHRVVVRNYCVSYDVSGSGVAKIPADVAEYLEPSEDINSEAAEIVEFARSAAASSSNPYLQARLLFAAVNEHMTYDNSTRSNHSAQAAYNIGSGNCEDYANLYAACLRAVGIPARVCGGYLYGAAARTDKSYISDSGHINAAMLRHNWVEFYIAGTGWLVADPTSASIAAGGSQAGGSQTIDNLMDWDKFARITDENRLIYTCDYFPAKDIISYEYQGAAPLMKYTSELALYAVILPFTDLAGHWAQESVLGLYYHTPRILKGLTDDYFGVNENMTRAELATMLNRVLDEVEPLDSWSDKWFVDLAGTHWAYNEIGKAVARGILTGYPDGTVRPDALVSRAEAAVMLNRVIGGLQDNQNTSQNNQNGTVYGRNLPYVDIGAFGWALRDIAGMFHFGIMQGVDSEHFAPQQMMTRGEGAAVIYRWLNSDMYRDKYNQ